MNYKDTEAKVLPNKRQDARTSHVLHLVLYIISLGSWAPVWLIVGVINISKRNKIDDRLRDLSID